MKKILIIDDDIKVRDIYKRFLTSHGLDVLEAENAQQALNALIREDKVDLVILDLKIPEIAGEYIYEIIQEYDPNMKIIISSVYPYSHQQDTIKDVYAYHDKSEGLDKLFEKVEKAML